MKNLVMVSTALLLLAAAAHAAPAPAASPASPDGVGKLPITTASPDALKLYLQGRDRLEKLRGTDARALFTEAVAKDKSFAMAYVGLANSAGTTKEFFDALDGAVAAAKSASAGEQLLVDGLSAGAHNNPAKQRELYTKLAKQFPRDERVATLLGTYYLGQQDYAHAASQLDAATKLNPKFTAPYNQLGYAYRFLGKYADAERAFKKYIELIPDDPNPYDSYGELLMKMGRFDESIASYQHALEHDPKFVASYVGIGNDQIFLGKGDDARKTFGKLLAVARNDGEKRQARLWIAVSYTHEGAWDPALGAIHELEQIAAAAHDDGQAAADLNFEANTLLEAGRPDEALAKFAAQVASTERASVPAEGKEAARRNTLYDQGRVALAKHDLATAKARAAEYGKQVAAKAIPFEQRQLHELLGQLAIEEKRWPAAAAELAQANQQDPRVLYLRALAEQGAGHAAKAKTFAAASADFNQLAFNYGYVRGKARALK